MTVGLDDAKWIWLLFLMGLISCANGPEETEERTTTSQEATGGTTCSACCSNNETSNWELLFADQSPVDGRASELDKQIEEYLRMPVETGCSGPDDCLKGLTEMSNQRAKAHNEIRFKFLEYLDDQGSFISKEAAYASFRIGQLYFDFACQVQSIECLARNNQGQRRQDGRTMGPIGDFWGSRHVRKSA